MAQAAVRKSVLVQGNLNMAAFATGGRGATPGSNKLGAQRLELLETSFSAYADESTGKVGVDDIEKVLQASLSRYLEREMEEMRDEHDDDAELQLHDIKGMVMNRPPPFINKQWQDLIGARPKGQQVNCDPDDLFHQLY